MQTFEQVLESLTEYLPNLLAAVGILVGGWLVALIVAALVRALLHRSHVDDRIVGWVGGPEAKKVPIEDITRRIVFYTVMVFVLVAFLEAVGLALLTEPLNQLLNEIFVFAPRLLAAALLLAVAWIVGSALRIVVTAALRRLKVDERLGSERAGEEEVLPLSGAFGEVVYWLVFLLFLPAVLGALALDGLLEPLQGMVNEVLSYLPNLLSAGLILGIGWFGARIVQRILRGILVAAGIDRLSQRVGVEGVIGGQPLSSLIALVGYVIVLIPVLVAALNALGLDAVTAPASELLATVLGVLPALFAAVLVLAVAYFVGRVVGRLASSLLEGVGFDKLVKNLGLWPAEAEGPAPSDVAGHLTVVVVLLFATIEAFALLGFTTLAVLFTDLTAFGGNVLIALIVFAAGLYLANVADNSIGASGVKQGKWLAVAARVAILALAGTMALQQVGVAAEIITLAFGLTLGALAVALAIAFGLGGRDQAAQQLEEWRRGVRK